nr:MAG TPA: hypothetical protein [Caudoviricetes sp.]DAH91086.1 MAG TPA: hypothetical protein [Caudoviricetes sp.]DAV43349.1 MAG TPA: hypothetical protein [Caudoviricetes sp.]DAZ34940.1 MAG TPA: hypothetical protein [Caudoviricetes sp.]DAZ53133.1 MAG TPA: hypothetical protein [Caudoviricetes sp.]
MKKNNCIFILYHKNYQFWLIFSYVLYEYTK